MSTSRHRRLRIALTATGALVITVLALVVWLLLSADEPRPVTLDEARDRTRGSTMTTAPADAFGPPAPGVYLYRGAGSEKTSVPPLTEEQGPTMPATVTPDGAGCWRFRIDYNSHHWQDWRFCADPSGIVTTGGRSFARREFGTFNVDNTSTFSCIEPNWMLWKRMSIGDVRSGDCTGTSTAVDGSTLSSGTTTYVGDDEIEVSGRTIRARHLRSERDLTGAQTGSERTDWWVDPLTVLPIRNEHRVRVDTKVGGLTITYTEIASFTLESLVAQ